LRLYFDAETDGLLPTVSKVHSLVIRDLDTEELFSYADQPGYPSIQEGLSKLDQADELWGHNIVTYDLPMLAKVRRWQPRPGVRIRDSLVIARMVHYDINETDWRREGFPSKLVGKHSLKAWGYRLRNYKGDFGENTDWSTWSVEMQQYCEQDVLLGCDLVNLVLRLVEAEQTPESSIEMEHEFANLMGMQERHGFRFDRESAGRLYADLSAKRDEITKKLRLVFGSRFVEMKTPAYYTTIIGGKPSQTQFPTKAKAVAWYKALGVPAKDRIIKPGPNKRKEIPFKPSSRDDIAARLKERGWVPAKFTEGGKPQVDESVLEPLEATIPEAKLLNEYLLIEKRIGQLAEGKQAMLKHERNGRIHGAVNPIGCVTTRCAHFSPNVAQTPKVGSPYGWEFRSLYLADILMVLVGGDASGLELRTFANYLALWDGGEYARIVCEGKSEDGTDVHTANQRLAGLPTRDSAKTFIYALLYGAGDYKLGTICGVTDEDIARYKVNGRNWSFSKRMCKRKGLPTDDRTVALCIKGASMRAKFMKGLPAYAKLVEAVQQRVTTKGYIIAVDGRRLRCRAKHSALNTLLQSAGALCVKKATVILYHHLTALGYVFGVDYAFVAHVHDELQITCRPELADQIGQLIVQSIKEAGEAFKLRVPLTGEYKVGKNWAETH
jgi:DNA polymerase-1